MNANIELQRSDEIKENINGREARHIYGTDDSRE